jgi:hypothetical protein
MSFFLTDSQEDELNLFLDEQNRQACEEQLKSRLLPDELSEIIEKSVEADSPLPAFDPIVGYYTISFTPCSDGNRIYAHHHINNKSISLCDPARDDINLDVEDIKSLQGESLTEENIRTDDVESDYIPTEISTEEVVANYGGPPQSVLDEMGISNIDELMQQENSVNEPIILSDDEMEALDLSDEQIAEIEANQNQ